MFAKATLAHVCLGHIEDQELVGHGIDLRPPQSVYKGLDWRTPFTERHGNQGSRFDVRCSVLCDVLCSSEYNIVHGLLLIAQSANRLRRRRSRLIHLTL